QYLPIVTVGDVFTSSLRPPPCSFLFPYTTLFRSQLLAGQLQAVLSRGATPGPPAGRCTGRRHERSSLPVSSRKTSSRVCRSTEIRSGMTPFCAHQDVTVASSWGSTLPSTR